MDSSVVTVISSSVEALGIGVFVNYMFKGLNIKIKALQETISVQEKTISAMDQRVDEVRKIGDEWKDYCKTLPEFVKDYDKIVKATKDRTIKLLQSEVDMLHGKLNKYTDLKSQNPSQFESLEPDESNQKARPAP